MRLKVAASAVRAGDVIFLDGNVPFRVKTVSKLWDPITAGFYFAVFREPDDWHAASLYTDAAVEVDR